MSPEQLLRLYFRAKDENRPNLLIDVFASDARLEINNRSAQISFPAVTAGREAIADVLVRQFNVTYENIYSFDKANMQRIASLEASLVGTEVRLKSQTESMSALLKRMDKLGSMRFGPIQRAKTRKAGTRPRSKDSAG